MSRVRLNGSVGLHDGGFAYSAAVAPGPLVFTAGISPLDGDGAVVAADDVAGQTRRCLEILRTVLADQDCSFADIVKLTVYVVERVHPDLVVAWQAVAAEFDAPVPPAMLMGVTGLGYADQLVELEAIAAPTLP